MKILITTDLYEPVINGVVTSVINLKKELEERGHDVRILTLSRTCQSHIEGNVYYIKSIDMEKIYPNVRAVWPHRENFIQELIQWKPDIVHSQCEFMTFSYAVKISRKAGCPLVHTYHTIYEDYLHYLPGHLLKRCSQTVFGKQLAAGFSRRVLKKAQEVIVPTKKVEKILKSYNIESPISVIPTGIDLKNFQNSLSEEGKRRKTELGISEKSKVLVSVGRLGKEKNLEEILLYFKRFIKENGRDYVLLLVGDGPDRERLESLVEVLELRQQVIFTGMIPPEKVREYYQLGDVFVSASNSETQGITYIEALASGIPALCRKDECIHEVIIDGYNGFQYENYEYFNVHLLYMMEQTEERIQMGKNAKELADLYSTWNFCTMVEQLYKRLVAECEKEKVKKALYIQKAKTGFVWKKENILRKGV